MAVIPVGKVESSEVEATLSRLAKGLRRQVELKGSLPVPQGVEDPTRAQFRASVLMSRLRSMVPQLGPGKLVGGEGESEAGTHRRTDAYMFVTDVDLFTANSDGVFSALIRSKGLAVISLRRLRESYYRRKAAENKQRSRLAKELLRMGGRLLGAPECSDPKCVMSASKMFADLDLKEERFCRACSQRLFEGKVQI
jgi:predicted Zn-dependent protease